jgi:hypothetical protein
MQPVPRCFFLLLNQAPWTGECRGRRVQLFGHRAEGDQAASGAGEFARTP